jgi:putative transposase
VAFIDEQRAQEHAVESICRVLREQGLAIAARTYRSWKRANRPVADRTHSDAQVLDAVRDLAWRTEKRIDPQTGVITQRRRLAPEGLYGRRKMTAFVRRRRLPEAWAGSVDRAMRALGLSEVRRDRGIRTTISGKDGKRAGDLLDRDFTASAPNRVWVTDFTYVRTWAGFVYVAFIWTSSPNGSWPGTPRPPSTPT